ncbi:hypothetical protein [Tenacibaculum sp.]|uniref:hypothetical protein n=1 Tax=Tenacibaculum sp. TaxID=1906242 RepID=UPI003AA7F233
MSKLFFIGFGLAIMSFLLFLIVRRKVIVKNNGYFVAFLFCMFFFDVLGLTLARYQYNNALYNLLSLVEFNLLFLFYFGISENKVTKKVIIVSIISYGLVYVMSSVYYGVNIFSKKYNTVAPVFGATFIGVVLILYLREFLLTEKILSYKEDVFFWITTGLLLYYIGTIPLTAMLGFMERSIAFDFLYKIQHVLTIIMHSCFLIGMLWSLKKGK